MGGFRNFFLVFGKGEGEGYSFVELGRKKNAFTQRGRRTLEVFLVQPQNDIPLDAIPFRHKSTFWNPQQTYQGTIVQEEKDPL